MQALSHFSYHISGGKCVLCDLQGGVYSNAVVLTDPVITSLKTEYGPPDLGPDGINNFFSYHTCNEFCKSYWILPAQTRPCYPAKPGTSMSSAGSGAMLHVCLAIKDLRKLASLIRSHAAAILSTAIPNALAHIRFCRRPLFRLKFGNL